MTFMQNLAANPNGGSSSIYGQPGPNNDQDSLGIVNRLKDREMKDFQDKANFMADLSLKQDRMRKIYSMDDEAHMMGQPNTPSNGQTGQPGQNTVIAPDPNQMTGYQKGELSVRQQGNNIESQRINQQGKLGEQALGIKSDQEKLNQQKSDQINKQKQDDMQRKTEEADAKIKLAQDKLQQAGDNAAASLQAHKDIAAAVEARHKLELSQKDAQFQTTHKQMQDKIDQMTEQLKQKGRSQTTTETNSDGTKRETTTLKGSAAETVQVTGKDGKTYTIPKDKVDDWNANHKPDSDQGEE